MAATKGPHRPVTEDELEQLRQGHAAGESLNSIARRLGRSTQTVHAWSRREKPPLSWDTSRVQAANIARADHARERRQIEADRIHALLDDRLTHGESVREGSFKALVKGQGGAEVEAVFDFIPADHGRQLAASITQLVNAAMKIEAVDVDAELVQAKSLIADLASELGVLPMEPE